RASSPPPDKARINKSEAKFMFILMDRQGMLLSHVVPNGYSKRTDTCDCKKGRTRLELSLLDLEAVEYPPFSPDLAPVEFA
ncbi:hypothetical protein MAR_024453, partial [Mya arenaria]